MIFGSQLRSCRNGVTQMSKESVKVLLVVEDNPGDARLLREMINEQVSQKIELIHAECMSEAEKYLAEREVHVVLLDLGLPDAQGMGAIRRVRAAAPPPPFVWRAGLGQGARAPAT